MPLTRFRRAPLVLNPSILALSTWGMVGVLYSLHLSKLLLFSNGEVIRLLVLIVVPTLVISLCFWLANRSQRIAPPAATVVLPQPLLSTIDQRMKQGWRLWIYLAAIETIVSGGVPLQWILTGSGKANFDYGIPSVHGMVNALLLAVATTSFALYLYTGRRSYLRVPGVALIWSLVLVSRGTLMVLVVECLVIFFWFRRIRWTSLLRVAGLLMALLLIFGVVGDFRSGAEAFRTLAQPTPDFPDWAPSGVLWAYIYITTPINNLLYSMHTLTPIYNILLPNTATTLFPTVIRNVLYGAQSAQESISGSLVTEALNVSTAYVGPFQDLGKAGIAGFSVIAASLCELYWRRNGFRSVLIFSVFAQAFMLSLFYNLLFSLPVLGQIVWFLYFTPPQGAASSPSASNPSHEMNYA